MYAELGKAVSYVKFMSRLEVVAARISSSLLLWDLTTNRCVRTMTGHVNVRNFVGMEVNGLYIACGSESSQVQLSWTSVDRWIRQCTASGRLLMFVAHTCFVILEVPQGLLLVAGICLQHSDVMHAPYLIFKAWISAAI
jgi:WD40 repeat protein